MVNNMTTNRKDISVNFVLYEPYETFPDIVAHLGKISDNDLNKIMSAFNTSAIAPNACIKSLDLNYQDNVKFGRIPGNSKRDRTLELDSMFYFDTTPMCGKPNCKLDNTAKIKRCARNLKNGKCVDEFIRNTLGAVLYPQHYAKDKQK